MTRLAFVLGPISGLLVWAIAGRRWLTATAIAIVLGALWLGGPALLLAATAYETAHPITAMAGRLGKSADHLRVAIERRIR